MDLTTIVDSVTESLIPYFKADQSDDTPLADAAPANVRAIWSIILSKFNSDPQAETVARALSARPNSPDIQNAFREKLREVLRNDSVLLAHTEANVAANEAQPIARPIIEIDPEDKGTYPRPMPSRRRCEG